MQPKTLKSTTIPTPLGDMLAIGDNEHLYLLKLTAKKHTERAVADLKRITGYAIEPGECKIHSIISQELSAYFAKTLTKFTAPLFLTGTDFQKQAWLALCKIPFGQTRSYLKQAELIKKPKAYRAVANANARNKLEIIVPCHRVITHTGKLGGYAGGIDKKQWLLYHENPQTKNNYANVDALTKQNI